MRRLVVAALFIVGIYCVRAEETPTPKIVAGPYIQCCSQDAFTVVWQTNVDALSWVEIAPDDGTHFYNTTRRQFFHTIHGRRSIGRWHKVTVSGLDANTVYRYRVFNKGILSNNGGRGLRYSEGKGSDVFRREPYRVRTLGGGDTTRFAVGNDFHDNPKLLEKLFSKKVITRAKYDFVLYNGDMVSKFESEEQLLRSVISPSVVQFATEVPLFMVRGNHETRGMLAIAYADYFPSKTTTPYYTFCDGPAFFIVLDCGEDKPDSDIEYHDLARFDDYRKEQATWLEGVVASDEFRAAAVRIVIAHIPPLSNGWHGSAEVAQRFVPILNEAGIDAMFCGHIHKYQFCEAGNPLRGCNFPVVCNPNRTRMDVVVSREKIVYTISNAEKVVAEKELTVHSK